MTSEKRLLKSTIVTKVKNYIVQHKLAAGDKLPTERKLAEMFNVSRSVVREALSYLENTGVIRVRQGQGAFINESNITHLVSNFFFLWQINDGDIRDIQNLRLLFESAAMDEIVRRKNDTDLHELRKRIEEGRQAKTNDSFRGADSAFHQQLLKATGNVLFQQMTQVITSYFFEVAMIDMDASDKTQGIEEHENIVDALEDGDVEQAKRLLHTHMHHVKI